MAGWKKVVSQGAVYAAVVALGLGIGWGGPKAWSAMKPRYTEGDYSSYYPDAHTQVVVYGTSWCQYCARTRAYLRSHNIAFADLDIEKSPAAMRQYAALGGTTSVPLVLVGRRKFNGFNPAVIEDATHQLAH